MGVVIAQSRLLSLAFLRLQEEVSTRETGLLEVGILGEAFLEGASLEEAYQVVFLPGCLEVDN